MYRGTERIFPYRRANTHNSNQEPYGTKIYIMIGSMRKMDQQLLRNFIPPFRADRPARRFDCGVCIVQILRHDQGTPAR